MTRRPSRPPSAAALVLASFTLTAAALAGPPLLHQRAATLAAAPRR